MLEDDPAISTSVSSRPSGSFSTHSYASKGKGKLRAVNGKEKPNGNASSSKRERKPKDVNGRWSYGDVDMDVDRAVDGIEVSWNPGSWSEDPTTLKPTMSHPIPTQNGMLASPLSYLAQARANVPIRSEDEQPAERSSSSSHTFPHGHPTFHPQDDTVPSTSWPGQYTGPASGFLQPNGSFHHIRANPGRTIYSSQQSPQTETGSF
jgi:hypothetical protein